MKYCPNCGTQLDDNAMFCHSCGTRLAAPNAATSRQANYINEELADKATRAAAIITEAEQMCLPVVSMVQEADKTAKRENFLFGISLGKYSKYVGLVDSIVMLLFAVSLLIGGRMILAILIGILGVVMLVLTKPTADRNKRKHDNKINASEQKRQQAQQILFQAQQYLAENDDVVSVIPEDYRYSTAADYIAKSLRNGSASTMKEAVVNCDNYLHQLRMEQYQQTQLENQELIMMQLRHLPDYYY